MPEVPELESPRQQIIGEVLQPRPYSGLETEVKNLGFLNRFLFAVFADRGRRWLAPLLGMIISLRVGERY